MDIEAVIDDLKGLAEYLSNVDPQDMGNAELADWRYRLESARDCLSEIERTYGGNHDEGDPQPDAPGGGG